MVKRFFICNLVFILSLCCPSFSEENSQTKEVETCTSYKEEVIKDLNTQLDALFQDFLEGGQELYQDFLEAGQNINFADNMQIIEFIKSSSSGQKLLQACEEILAYLHMPSEEITNTDLSYDIFLKKLDDIIKLWQEHYHAKEREYFYKELELREKELEFQKDLLSWKKEKMAKELAWKKEKYVQDKISRRFS